MNKLKRMLGLRPRESNLINNTKDSVFNALEASRKNFENYGNNVRDSNFLGY